MLRLGLLLTILACIYSYDSAYWEIFTSNPTQYFAINNSTIWRVSTAAQSFEGYQTFVWNPRYQSWSSGAPICTKIALSSKNLFCIQNDYTVLQIADLGKGNFTTLPFKAYDLKVSISNATNIWYASLNSTQNECNVYKYNEISMESTLIPGTNAIAVGPAPDGAAWVVTSSNTTRRYTGSKWIDIPTRPVLDIVVNGLGIPYILSTKSNQLLVWDQSSSTFILRADIVSFGSIKMAVDTSNILYIANPNNNVFRTKGGQEIFCPCIHLSHPLNSCV